MFMKSAVAKCSLAAFILALCVVVLGAFTRLADAGLGCPDWPTCYGHLWVPLSEADVAKANEKFAETPVEHHKTWPEQLHRLFASTLGLVILAIFFLCYRALLPEQRPLSVLLWLGVLVASTIARIFVGDALDPFLFVVVGGYFLNLVRLTLRRRQNPSSPGQASLFRHAALLAGMVILQGLFGMWTVTLYLWPKVVTAHLLGGFATLGLLWLLFQRLIAEPWRLASPELSKLLNLRLLAALALAVVIVQIALGGWVSSNYAALACPDFPKCQNSWWPHADFYTGFNVWQSIGPNYLGGLLDNEARIAIHLMHRLGALLVTGVLLVLAWQLWRSGLAAAQKLAAVLVAILIVQIGLGISNIVLSLPLPVAVAHNAVGALLLLCVITVNYRIHSLETR